MLQLVNISNHAYDRAIIGDNAACLAEFLAVHKLDGVELLFWEEWDPFLYRQEWIKGAHLRFWPNWLDFWRGNRGEVLRQLGSEQQVYATFGGWAREAWLRGYRREIAAAVKAGAGYLVFHVSQVRPEEMYDWRFSATDWEVAAASLEIINELADCIPPEVELLYENLWWPGLTLREPEIAARLLADTKHPNTGLMLDTGHLLNGNQDLGSQEQAVDYVLQTVAQLGAVQRRLRGMHLHYSLSGRYVRQRRQQPGEFTPEALMQHAVQIDQHRPFSSPRVRELVKMVQPAYLVHEFIYSDMTEWAANVSCQQQALGCSRAGSL